MKAIPRGRARMLSCFHMLVMIYGSGKYGSEQEFERRAISCGSPESDEFSFGSGHALSLEEQVAEVLVPASAAQDGFDVAVDGLHHSEANLDAAVVEDAFDMIGEQVRQLLEGRQALPAKLQGPALQIAQHRALVGVRPQSLQTFLEEVRLHHFAVQREEAV